jgi:hypothetical protein
VPPSMTYSAPVMVAARSEAWKAIRLEHRTGNLPPGVLGECDL